MISFSTGTDVGSVATHICTPGFFLIGASTRTCQGDGGWSGTDVKCVGENNRTPSRE